MTFISENNLAALIGTSNRTVQTWGRNGLYPLRVQNGIVPLSEGAQYPEKKKRVLAMVPQGGDWRNLPEEVAKDYMGGSWLLGGGKTGMARRLSLDEPSLTLTCSPCQKQTDKNDLRLVLEVQFVKQLFEDYKPVELKIWQTFTDTTVDKLINK